MTWRKFVPPARDCYSVHLRDGSVANTKTVIVATGVRYQSLGVEGLSKLSGTGVYHSATQVEALLCDERPLHVIGAGNSAGQAAMFLSRFNANVNLIVRGGDLRKSMSSYLAERVEANSRIHVRLHSELRAVPGRRFPGSGIHRKRCDVGNDCRG